MTIFDTFCLNPPKSCLIKEMMNHTTCIALKLEKCRRVSPSQAIFT